MFLEHLMTARCLWCRCPLSPEHLPDLSVVICCHWSCLLLHMLPESSVEIQFAMGDAIYLDLCPYHMKSLTRWDNKKLGPMFFYSCKVLKNFQTCHLQAGPSDTMSLHPVFHVLQLCKALCSDHRLQLLPATLSSKKEWVVVLSSSQLSDSSL